MMQLIYVVVLFKECNETNYIKRILLFFNEMPFSISEVKDKQRPGTDVIRTKVLPSKPKRKIT